MHQRRCGVLMLEGMQRRERVVPCLWERGTRWSAQFHGSLHRHHTTTLVSKRTQSCFGPTQRNAAQQRCTYDEVILQDLFAPGDLVQRQPGEYAVKISSDAHQRMQWPSRKKAEQPQLNKTCPHESHIGRISSAIILSGQKNNNKRGRTVSNILWLLLRLRHVDGVSAMRIALRLAHPPTCCVLPRTTASTVRQDPNASSWALLSLVLTPAPTQYKQATTRGLSQRCDRWAKSRAGDGSDMPAPRCPKSRKPTTPLAWSPTSKGPQRGW